MRSIKLRDTCILIVVFALFLNINQVNAQENKPPMTIMLIIDGLASGAIDRIPLKHLKQLKTQGTYYKELYLPLAAHPDKSNTYPWSCSLPNPVLMSGTVFIGQNRIKQHLIQHSFKDRKTAFIVNDKAYLDVSQGFDIYLNLRENFEDIFKDQMVFETTKKVIKNENPEFLRVHIQGPGSSGHKSNEKINQNEVWYQNIWHPDSPYRSQLKKADELVHEFINWLINESYMPHTTLFILGDHGQADTGGHPPYKKESNITELLILGKNIKKNKSFDYAEIIDIAPTITNIHNIHPPKYSKGRILKEAFKQNTDSIPENKAIQELNALLINAEHLKSSDTNISTRFKRILDIGTWHNALDSISLKQFIHHQKSVLD